MRLAKDHIDVGLFTNAAPAMLQFWQQRIGLKFEETLPLGGGVRQHRHAMNGSVLKINDARDPLADDGLAGYREIIIARDGITAPETLEDPDGNRVTLVPRGHDGIEGIAVRLVVRDPAAFDRFYGDAMQFERAGEHAYRCGDSLLLVEQDASAQQVGRMQARGLRYITVQVWDVDAEHAGIAARGGTEGRAPLTLGSTARISFVRDPDGNWIEISQRASLTGELPAG
ncbi:MAG TPA: VOC family protein [Dehalococcoidia bacterium]|nr:VOC family protein [Dehalococcoidia bacterium]